jgi:two-component system chemotaxis sensor kinase CheA
MIEGNQSNINLILDTFYRYDLNKFFKIDLELIEEALGNEFLETNRMLNIESSLIDNLELKIKKLESIETHNLLEEILSDFKHIRSESVMQQLNIYPIAVKQMAQKLEKEIYPLKIIGDQTLKVPSEFKPFLKSLIHLFNNCVEHGIEDIETRILHNKDEIGTIQCSYSLENGNLQIIIKDDGRGINIDKLSQKALENNIKTEDELAHMSDDEKALLIFADNLSTKDEVSTTSGRGVGMSAIQAECEKLNGTIKIKSNIGIGTEFIFTIPLNKEN